MNRVFLRHLAELRYRFPSRRSRVRDSCPAPLLTQRFASDTSLWLSCTPYSSLDSVQERARLVSRSAKVLAIPRRLIPTVDQRGPCCFAPSSEVMGPRVASSRCDGARSPFIIRSRPGASSPCGRPSGELALPRPLATSGCRKFRHVVEAMQKVATLLLGEDPSAPALAYDATLTGHGGEVVAEMLRMMTSTITLAASSTG